jgi:hypothetical protein
VLARDAREHVLVVVVVVPRVLLHRAVETNGGVAGRAAQVELRIAAPESVSHVATGSMRDGSTAAG